MKISDVLSEAQLRNPNSAFAQRQSARRAASTQQVAANRATPTQPAAPTTTASTQTTPTQPAAQVGAMKNTSGKKSGMASFLQGAGFDKSASAIRSYPGDQAEDGEYRGAEFFSGNPRRGAAAQSQNTDQEQNLQQPTAQQPTQPDQSQDQQQQTAQPQVQGSANLSNLFKNPTSFKAEWDKYVASKGGDNYKLISDPSMLNVLKHIWMRTGGTKVQENKKSARKSAK